MKNILIMLMIVICISAFCDESGESSLENSWAVRHIQRLTARNASPHLDVKSNISPESHLTRGQLAVLICRLIPNGFKEKENYTEEYNAVYFFHEQKPDNFADYSAKPEFGYVEQAVKRRILEERTETFEPGKLVSRGEFIKTVMIMLEKTTDENCQIPGLALRAYELNQHLTKYQDVSVNPAEYPGWVKTAQEYNLLPKRYDDSTSVTAPAFSMGIPYRQVFYNPQKKTYEFDAGQPVSMELAMAVLSNLFVKWDIYSEMVPFDQHTGNRNRDILYRMAGEVTKSDARIENIDRERRIFQIRSQARIEKNSGKNTFQTMLENDMEEIVIPENIPLWLNYRGKWVSYNGAQNLSRLKIDLDRLSDESLCETRVNIITKREKMQWKREEFALVCGMDGEMKKLRQAAYVEVIADPFDYSGRVLAVRDNEMQIMDYRKGEAVFCLNEKTDVQRKIRSDISGTSATDTYLDPRNKDLYERPWKCLQTGEEVYIKIKREDPSCAVRIVSYLNRVGKPVSVDIRNGRMITDSLVGGFYQTASGRFDPVTVQGFEGIVMPSVRTDRNSISGDLNVLYRDGVIVNSSVIYVQPANAVPSTQDKVLPSGQIRFMIAVSR